MEGEKSGKERGTNRTKQILNFLNVLDLRYLANSIRNLVLTEISSLFYCSGAHRLKNVF